MFNYNLWLEDWKKCKTVYEQQLAVFNAITQLSTDVTQINTYTTEQVETLTSSFNSFKEEVNGKVKTATDKVTEIETALNTYKTANDKKVSANTTKIGEVESALNTYKTANDKAVTANTTNIDLINSTMKNINSGYMLQDTLFPCTLTCNNATNLSTPNAISLLDASFKEDLQSCIDQMADIQIVFTQCIFLNVSRVIYNTYIPIKLYCTGEGTYTIIKTNHYGIGSTSDLTAGVEFVIQTIGNIDIHTLMTAAALIEMLTPVLQVKASKLGSFPFFHSKNIATTKPVVPEDTSKVLNH